MRLLNMLFGNKELNSSFIDNRTTFILSSYPDEGANIFRETPFKLVKKIKHKKGFIYLIESEQNFTGIDFGLSAVPINRFIMAIRMPSSFKIGIRNDVIIYLPNDVKRLYNFKECLNDLLVVNWAYIHSINNEIT